MLHARLSLFPADTRTLDECAKYVERQLRAEVESQPGNLGLSLLVRPESGDAIAGTFWASADWQRASEDAEAPLRDELARRARGPVTVERYAVPIFERETQLRNGLSVRLTRVGVTPSWVDNAIEAVGDTAIPQLAETPGFRSALLLADPDSGQLISETVWRDPQARAASPDVAAIIRDGLLDQANCEIGAVADYDLVFSSVYTPAP